MIATWVEEYIGYDEGRIVCQDKTNIGRVDYQIDELEVYTFYGLRANRWIDAIKTKTHIFIHI